MLFMYVALSVFLIVFFAVSVRFCIDLYFLINLSKTIILNFILLRFIQAKDNECVTLPLECESYLLLFKLLLPYRVNSVSFSCSNFYCDFIKNLPVITFIKKGQKSVVGNAITLLVTQLFS